MSQEENVDEKIRNWSATWAYRKDSLVSRWDVLFYAASLASSRLDDRYCPEVEHREWRAGYAHACQDIARQFKFGEEDFRKAVAAYVDEFKR